MCDPPMSSINRQPRKIRGGIRLKCSTDDLNRHPPSAWVLEFMDEWIEPTRRVQGFTYAVDGQVRTIDIHSGGISATVQCARERPHRVVIELPVMSNEQWVTVAEHMAREARIAARLAAGRVPAQLAGVFRECGLSPIGDALVATCSCRAKRPCLHVAAALYVAAEQLNAEPMRYFGLRGTNLEDLLQKLRQARTLEAQGHATAHAGIRGDDMPPSPPLDTCLDSFWRSPRSLDEVEREPMPPHLPHALLRRLGLSPMAGKFPMAGLLETIYDDISNQG